jgi:carbon-monoxide dehydrogenase large subunit
MSSHVTYVGEAIAVVIADSPYAAADAANLVEVEYEELPIVTFERAMMPDSARVHADYDNVVAQMRFAVGDIDSAFSSADFTIEKRFEVQSVKAMAIECRGITAHWDAALDTLNVWSTTQAPYSLRDTIANTLGLPSDQVRVIARDVGGGFGLKGGIKQDDLIVAIAAFKLKVPIRWIETRMEHMVASNQSGRQCHDVRVACDNTGKILGLDLNLVKEVGAYNHYATMLPANTVNHLTTHYKVPSLRFTTKSVATNTVTAAPFRGAGRVEAVFTMDRILDGIARKLEIDPFQVRMRNIVPYEEMPYLNGLIYRDGNPIKYKELNFPLLLETAIEKIDYWGWRDRQKSARRKGQLIGIGISSYVEAGGMGPSESATIKLDNSGRASVLVGVNSQGQAHETTLSQICSATLGISFDKVTVYGGDTRSQHLGFGTGASRVAINAGNAVYKASVELKAKIAALAASIFECEPAEVEVSDSVAAIKGRGQQFITFGELATRSQRHPKMADLGGAGLVASASFFPSTVTWSSGVNVVVVEIDRYTGQPKILKYVFVHDSGEPLNPAVVEGQIMGGMAQGLGIALGERALYDMDGQVLSGSMMDYFVPRATDVPRVDLYHVVFPTDDNPLGIKSVGESGPNSPPAAIASAIEDALDGKLEITSLPVSWDSIIQTIRTLD